MTGIWIAPVNPVAENRDAGHRRSRNDQELVRDARKIIEHAYRRVADGVQKNHLTAHLVDGDEASTPRQCCFHHLTCSPRPGMDDGAPIDLPSRPGKTVALERFV